MNLCADELLIEIHSTLSQWDERIDVLTRDVIALKVENTNLREELSQQQTSIAQWLTPKEAYNKLGFENVTQLREAIRKGHYKSGTEIQRHGPRLIRVNVAAIHKRYEREQTRRKIC